jgi:hypothetical protein
MTWRSQSKIGVSQGSLESIGEYIGGNVTMTQIAKITKIISASSRGLPPEMIGPAIIHPCLKS